MKPQCRSKLPPTVYAEAEPEKESSLVLAAQISGGQQVAGDLLRFYAGLLRIGQPHSWTSMTGRAGHAVGVVIYDVGNKHDGPTMFVKILD